MFERLLSLLVDIARTGVNSMFERLLSLLVDIARTKGVHSMFERYRLQCSYYLFQPKTVYEKYFMYLSDLS